MKVLIAVTHLLGTGHLARALTLAKAFVREGHDVVVLSGGRPAPHLDAEGVAVVQLPPLASDGVDFTKLLTDLGVEADASYHAQRRAMMTGAVYESLGIYKGICHTLRHGPVVDLVPKRA